MTLEEQVLTIEQAKHLQELGLNMSDALFAWNAVYIYGDLFTSIPKISHYELVYNSNSDEDIPIYTLQEILDKLPYDMTWDTWQWQIDHCGENMEYNDGDGYTSHREVDGSLLDKAYKMLCWVLENGYLKEEQK